MSWINRENKSKSNDEEKKISIFQVDELAIFGGISIAAVPIPTARAL